MSPSRPWTPVALAVLGAVQLGSPWAGLFAVLALPLARALPAWGALCALWVAGAHGAWLAGPPDAGRTGTVAAVHLRGDVDWVDVAPDGAESWRVRARLVDRPDAITPGARVRLTGRLERPPPADNPGGFDAADYLARWRVRWRLRGRLSVLEPGPKDPVLDWRSAVRQRLRRCADQFGAGVLRGVLLGDRSAVPEAAKPAFEATGTGHLLAVSGLHVGGLSALVFGLVGWLARRARSPYPERWAAAVALPAAVGYAALAQWPTSATRAALMVGLFLAGRALGRPSDPLNLLAFAAVVAVLGNPPSALEPGFQLSFAAVWALLWGAKGGGLIGAARVSVVAALATAPIQAWHFGTWPPLASLANVFVSPLAALILVPLGLFALVAYPVAPGLLDVAANLATAMVCLCEAVADVGGGVWIVGRDAAFWLALPLVVALTWRRPGFSVACAAVIVVLPIALRPGPHVDFIAVGQGDAVLIREGSRAFLVDAGPDPRASALLGHLRQQGVSRLSALLITHGHPDHFLGAAAVLRALPVDRVIYNGRWPHGPDWQALAYAAAQRGVPLQVARKETLGWPSLALDIRPADDAKKENDASLTVRVRGPAGDVLLTGDLERAGEQALVAESPSPVLVLKAGHHGSRTSTSRALLGRTRPQLVVASCGRGNRYGFPHREVRARVGAVPLWQTNVDGWVRVHLESEDPRAEALRRDPLSLEAR